MTFLTDASSLLGIDGPFASLLDNYRVRESQQQMASRIEQAIADTEILIAESGTGTGKTLAYLVPALGVVHFWWLVKADVREPVVYGVVLLALLVARLILMAIFSPVW